MDIICFHNPSEEYGFLSNWFLSDFQVKGAHYTSMEQFMMCQKAKCFRDEVIAKQILDINDVAEIKSLGRKVSGYDDHIWNGMRQIIVYEGLLAKFSQNKGLKENLQNTGDAVLAECAVKDCIWGIGLSMNDPRRLDQKQWKGQNLLGYSLMLVRDNVKDLQLN